MEVMGVVTGYRSLIGFWILKLSELSFSETKNGFHWTKIILCEWECNQNPKQAKVKEKVMVSSRATP